MREEQRWWWEAVNCLRCCGYNFSSKKKDGKLIKSARWVRCRSSQFYRRRLPLCWWLEGWKLFALRSPLFLEHVSANINDIKCSHSTDENWLLLNDDEDMEEKFLAATTRTIKSSLTHPPLTSKYFCPFFSFFYLFPSFLLQTSEMNTRFLFSSHFDVHVIDSPFGFMIPSSLIAIYFSRLVAFILIFKAIFPPFNFLSFSSLDNCLIVRTQQKDEEKQRNHFSFSVLACWFFFMLKDKKRNKTNEGRTKNVVKW